MAMPLAAALEGLQPPDNGFLSGEEKVDWARDRVRFFANGFERRRNGAYDGKEDQWEVQVADPDGAPRRIGLNCNPRRDAIFTAMQNNLPDGGSIGPLNLVSRPLRNGKTTWNLVAADADTDGAVDPDDVPF